ncbi:MAG TPA: hypothetical protein VGO11_20395 [Chthoniobacteraceae bacterium]|nr:hypothetical protein [Chthoniobacteraceae bacterium]
MSLAIWTLLGLCWGDALLQQSSHWSPSGAGKSDPQETLKLETETAVSLASRGTTPGFRDGQADICLALNAAFPFDFFGLKPLIPQRLSPERSVFDAGHSWFVALWLLLPPMVLLILSKRRLGYARTLRRFTVGSVAWILIGLALGWHVTGLYAAKGVAVTDSWANVVLSLMFRATACLALLAIVAGMGHAMWRAAAWCWNAGQRRQVHAGLIGTVGSFAVLAAASSLFCKSAIWLGWYTFDTRVNLLEPSARGAAFASGIILVLMLTAMGVRFGARNRRRWRPVMLRGCLVTGVALLAALLIPLPPYIGNFLGHGDYILKRNGDVISYADREASVRAGPDELYVKLSVDPVAAREKAEKVMERLLDGGALIPRDSVVMINAANSHRHLAAHPLVAMLLICTIVLLLGAVIVLGCACAGAWATMATWGLLHGRRGVLVSVVTLAMAAAAWESLTFTKSALDCHSILNFVMGARGNVVQRGVESLLAYEKDAGPGPHRLPWELIPELYEEFDGKWGAISQREGELMQKLGAFGATDVIFLSGAAKLPQNAATVLEVMRWRGLLIGACAAFPETLRMNLQRAGFPPPLIERALQSWHRELRTIDAISVARLARLSEEFQLLYTLDEKKGEWTLTGRGTMPIFAKEADFTAFLNRLDGIVALKEKELQAMSGLKLRPEFSADDLAKQLKPEWEIVGAQRQLLRCFAPRNNFHVDWQEKKLTFPSSTDAKNYEAACERLRKAFDAVKE